MGAKHLSGSDSETPTTAVSRGKGRRLSSSAVLARAKGLSPSRGGSGVYSEDGRRASSSDAYGSTDVESRLGTEEVLRRKEEKREMSRGRGGQGLSILGSLASIGDAPSVRFDMDTAYRALSIDPRLRSSMSQSKGYFSIDSDRVKGYTGSHTGLDNSIEEKGRRRERINSSNPIRQVRCRGSSALSTADFRPRNNEAFAAATGNRNSHSAFRSSSMNIDRTAHRNSREYHPHLSQAGESERTSDGGKHPDGSASLMSQAVKAAASADRGGGARRFIPGGSTDGKEFNVVARGSKVSRAATHYNAAVAARYIRQ